MRQDKTSGQQPKAEVPKIADGKTLKRIQQSQDISQFKKCMEETTAPNSSFPQEF